MLELGFCVRGEMLDVRRDVRVGLKFLCESKIRSDDIPEWSNLARLLSPYLSELII